MQLKQLTIAVLIISVMSIGTPCCELEYNCHDQADMAHSMEPDKGHQIPNPFEDDTPCSSFLTCGNCTGFILLESEAACLYRLTHPDKPSPRTHQDTVQEGFLKGLLKPPLFLV